jgi:hypothetical protein
MSKPNSIEMSSNDPVDVANPRYISLVVVEDSLNQRYYNKYNEPPNRERVTSFYSRVLDLDKLNSARKDVFETTEILENILSFLPAKNIFGVRRVSRLWNDIIAASIRLQEKMFLRLDNKPQEMWTVDEEHKIGANNFEKQYCHLNNTAMTFRRINDRPAWPRSVISPIALNPMLRRMYTNLPNVLRGLMRGPSEAATFTSWVDFLQHGKSDFWNTHLTGPPCLGASVVCLTLCFGRGWSDSGLTMRDVLKFAFEIRRGINCNSSDSTRWVHRHATMYDAIDAIKKKL